MFPRVVRCGFVRGINTKKGWRKHKAGSDHGGLYSLACWWVLWTRRYQVRGLIAFPDVSYQQLARSTPTIRTIIELLLGILCLGIPFLFADRVRYHGHFDVEGSHLPESTTPLFVIGW
ncbi:hypothetical protein JVT61DRAFT_6113 [Boletus reticuloceps]|uniref:Uncharacterized protein n=1 Tax=Boletus reticuloceps TaxID=495285 RepID=A0A8I2YLB0_9AGAM|nr:hypothetical protein JVT61DRAFT_6113 [Boletus reticuloceps]